MGDRCARCAASQRSNIVKQSFVAALPQPWGAAGRAARAAPRSNVPTLSNNRLLLRNGCDLRFAEEAAAVGDRCAR